MLLLDTNVVLRPGQGVDSASRVADITAMRTARSKSPQRTRKALQAELDRLTVPVARPERKPPTDDQRGKPAQPQQEDGRDLEAEAEEVRQMIEASYT